MTCSSQEAIYMVGRDYIIDGGYAVVWKNGIREILSRGFASSIFVKNNDVYITGVDNNLQGLVWKNNVITTGLIDGNQVIPTAIFIK
ncbi:MAG: hypothetical protein WA775_07670 [Psychroserpens sp.]|uniref:hypothetical protein n=1 Tax=Psychroserpens sp. TaxID=2020870 RepID=UPI003C70CADC